MEPIEIFIDSSEYSCLVYCGECSSFRQLYDSAVKAKSAGRAHKQDMHKDRGISVVTIHGE